MAPDKLIDDLEAFVYALAGHDFNHVCAQADVVRAHLVAAEPGHYWIARAVRSATDLFGARQLADGPMRGLWNEALVKVEGVLEGELAALSRKRMLGGTGQ